MIENIIGDQITFAIQYSISELNSPQLYGECQIWIGGNCLGGLEGGVYLTRVGKIIQSVYLMTDKLTLPEDLYELPDHEIFKIMEENRLDEKGTYWFMYTEGFDLMSKYVYCRNDMLYFLWQLRPARWNDFKIGDFPGQLFSAKVPISTYIQVANEFSSSLASIEM